jgi:hypothetical protein
MFKTGFEDRYLIMTTLKSFTTDPKAFIKEVEIGLENYKHKNQKYNRLTNACPHPLLEILAKIPKEDLVSLTSISPQKAAVVIFEELFKDNTKLYNEFMKASKSSGLERSAVELGEIIEKNSKLKSEALNNIIPKF